jgi:hypothetical protein
MVRRMFPGVESWAWVSPLRLRGEHEHVPGAPSSPASSDVLAAGRVHADLWVAGQVHGEGGCFLCGYDHFPGKLGRHGGGVTGRPYGSSGFTST